MSVPHNHPENAGGGPTLPTIRFDSQDIVVLQHDSDAVNEHSLGSTLRVACGRCGGSVCAFFDRAFTAHRKRGASVARVPTGVGSSNE